MLAKLYTLGSLFRYVEWSYDVPVLSLWGSQCSVDRGRSGRQVILMYGGANAVIFCFPALHRLANLFCQKLHVSQQMQRFCGQILTNPQPGKCYRCQRQEYQNILLILVMYKTREHLLFSRTYFEERGHCIFDLAMMTWLGSFVPTGEPSSVLQ